MHLRCLLALLVCCTGLFPEQCCQAGEAVDSILGSSGSDLQVCLQGEVLDTDGRAAKNILVEGALNTGVGSEGLEPRIEDNRFEIWIPVNQSRWHSLWLKASSSSGDEVAYLLLNAFELRQTALDGVTLTLRKPSRQVEIAVVHNGAPVAAAHVKAECGFGTAVIARTDADGTARIGLLPDQALQRLTAWTDDRRIGGFSFNRKAARDPAADQHIIELVKCRTQKFRFEDGSGAPVPGLGFVMQVATAPPEYNFLGVTEHSELQTDKRGEVDYLWFPAWDTPHFYAELTTDEWILDGDPKEIDDVAVFKVKRAQRRNEIRGRVLAEDQEVGGLFVCLQSFQAERENYSDQLSTFTSGDGSFAVDVLPGATYCAYVLDGRLASEVIDLIPYDPASDEVAEAELSVREGQPVEIIATTGPDRKPYSNLSISLRREHSYSWRENGQTRHGTAGPSWWATTDDAGRATTYALPGKVNVSVFTPLWRTQQSVTVTDGGPNLVELHREREEKRRFTGRLVLSSEAAATVAGAQLKIGSVDGNYDEQLTVACGEDGTFVFDALGAEVGIFAATVDGKAAGWSLVRDSAAPVELTLHPTAAYEGRLLTDGDKPLADHAVHAIVRVEGTEDYNGRFIKSFEAQRIETRTDEHGDYRLENVPLEMRVSIAAASPTDPQDTTYLDQVYLERGESRPRAVNRLVATSNEPQQLSLAKRCEKARRDAELLGYRVMVIASSEDASVVEFIDRNLLDYDANRNVSGYMQVVIRSGAGELEEVDRSYMQQHGWDLPNSGHVHAYALDAKLNELGRLKLDLKEEESPGRAKDFVDSHVPAQVDAVKKWEEAFAEAKRTGRRVWVRVSQRYCGPCFRLARWLDDQQELLAVDYVMLKVDDVRDKNGRDIAERLTQGEHHGVPFHAIFNADGEMLVNSAGPLGNVGHPSGYEGKKQLRKMLLTSRLRLSDEEVNRLVDSVGY